MSARAFVESKVPIGYTIGILVALLLLIGVGSALAGDVTAPAHASPITLIVAWCALFLGTGVLTLQFSIFRSTKVATGPDLVRIFLTTALSVFGALTLLEHSL